MKLISTASESGHWYSKAGQPAYTVLDKKGEPRPTTLRDARKTGLVPSVTTILKCAANPGLEAWKQNQILLAALTLPKLADESEGDWLKRVVRDSKEHGRMAAERGTIIHGALERYYDTGVLEAPWMVYQANVAEAVANHFGQLEYKAERSFATPLGYGGKVDLSAEGVVIDFKTKEFGEDDKVVAFDEHVTQLSAYRVGLGMPEARCANVFVSVSNPGLVRIVEHSEADLKKGWTMFNSLLNYWKAKNGVEP